MNDDNKLIRFDWAMKRLLRDKANFAVLEGLISTLLGKTLKIHRLLESESNKDDADDKQNRVDLLAEDEKGDLFLIEVQNENEYAYYQRILFGTSKLVTEYINQGENYEKVRKVYSISIVYFQMGYNTDYVYHGKTQFIGIHNGLPLKLAPFQQQRYEVSEVSELYPEYFILCAHDFNKWSRQPLEQWLYFLSNSEIPDDADAPGLTEARDKLRVMRMDGDERRSYYRHLDNMNEMNRVISTAWGEGQIDGYTNGFAEGEAKGRAEGEAKGRAEGEAKGREIEKEATACKLLIMGLSIDQVCDITGLSKSRVQQIKNKNN